MWSRSGSGAVAPINPNDRLGEGTWLAPENRPIITEGTRLAPDAAERGAELCADGDAAGAQAGDAAALTTDNGGGTSGNHGNGTAG